MPSIVVTRVISHQSLVMSHQSSVISHRHQSSLPSLSSFEHRCRCIHTQVPKYADSRKYVDSRHRTQRTVVHTARHGTVLYGAIRHGAVTGTTRRVAASSSLRCPDSTRLDSVTQDSVPPALWTTASITGTNTVGWYERSWAVVTSRCSSPRCISETAYFTVGNDTTLHYTHLGHPIYPLGTAYVSSWERRTEGGGEGETHHIRGSGVRLVWAGLDVCGWAIRTLCG